MDRHLPPEFYARDTETVARDLVGKRLRHGPVLVEITEVEAYPPGDTAAHTRHGRTPRNAPMWGPPGRAYVYLCYGIHWMLNLVTEPEGRGAAVLIRGARPIEGLDVIRERRGGLAGPRLLDGPGKVGQALALAGSFNHEPLHERGGIEGLEGEDRPALLVGPRVGIDYADEADLRAPRRFARADCPWVGRRETLTPLRAGPRRTKRGARSSV